MESTKINREVVNKAIIDIINLDVFDAEAERGIVSDKDYQIPERQRFPRWDEKDWPLLIDSIMNDYPMPNFLMTREVVNNKVVHFYQDGQTRGWIAQDYIKGRFLWNNKKYSELSASERSRFDRYQISVSIISKKPGTTDMEFNNICGDIFERVNKGKPLTDNDKFHNRMQAPLLRLIVTLKNDPEFRIDMKAIFGDVGGGKPRTYLANMVGLLLALMLNDSNFFRASYDKNAHYVIGNDESVVGVNEGNIDRVKAFLRDYFAMVKTIKDVSEYKIKPSFFNKPSGLLALYLTDWLAAKTRTEMWVDYAVKIIADDTYERRVFASLSEAQIRNNAAANFKARIECVVAAYEKRELPANEDYESAEESDEESGEESGEESD